MYAVNMSSLILVPRYGKKASSSSIGSEHNVCQRTSTLSFVGPTAPTPLPPPLTAPIP